MIALLFWLVQATPYQLPPTVAPAPAPDTAAFIRERERLVIDLRESCMSETGVRIAVQAWEAGRRNPPDLARHQAATREVNDAAFAAVIDVERLARAKAEQRRVQDAALSQYDADSIAVLRRLSTADRKIYARRLALARPTIPPPRCHATGRP